MTSLQDKLKVLSTNHDIPRQRLPDFIRWPLRVIAFPIMMADIFAQRFVRIFIRPKYVIKGACKQRGVCCQFIHMSWPSDGKKRSWASKVYIFWQTEVLGFYFKSFDFVESNEVTKVMGCRYLKPNGRCAHYKLRPAICRDWPKLHPVRRPQLIKGCGYKVELRKSKAL